MDGIARWWRVFNYLQLLVSYAYWRNDDCGWYCSEGIQFSDLLFDTNWPDISINGQYCDVCLVVLYWCIVKKSYSVTMTVSVILLTIVYCRDDNAVFQLGRIQYLTIVQLVFGS